MDTGRIPPQLRPVLNALATAMRSREPAIRQRVADMREEHPELTGDQLADMLIRNTRYRVAATGAAVGATAIAPGLGTLLALGTATGQSLYALEQEAELVCEVSYDKLQAGQRFRHATGFIRWRPDKPAGECRFDQIVSAARFDVGAIFAGSR